MAYVKAHYNRIVFRFRIGGKQHSTTVNTKPTKANIQAAKREAKRAENRLKFGEPWDSVRADLRGERYLTAKKSLGYYAQHLFDHWTKANSTLLDYE
ncbi:MAG: DUF3596 domain-containing protein [Pseudomonadales bacterium]|nr:DUF3596 domain-containing protein [Pseudomonadales bacterium]